MQNTLNIKVAVRVRPLLTRELEVSDIETIRVTDNQSLLLTTPTEISKKEPQNMQFDYVFDRLSSQKQIFETCLEYSVLSVLDGFNYTVFSYGGQGAGKTHTLVKFKEDYGLLLRTLTHLFTNIASKNRKITVYFSYLNIYQENLMDLLNNENLTLEIREDPLKGNVIAGAREVEVSSIQEVINLIQYANKQKNARQHGHEILQFNFIIQDMPGLTNDLTYSKLIVADLSYQERGQKNQNISLQQLNNCIKSLNEAREKNMQPYIPYRNSKLTRVLKESLGGNSTTLMVTCVSPAVVAFDDTVTALNMAQLAGGIINKHNIIKVQQDVPQVDYGRIVEGLKKENAELKKQLNDKSYISPILNVEEDMIKHFEERIFNHFNIEQDYTNQLFKYNWEIELINFRIVENQTNLQRIDGVDRVQADILRQQLTLDKNQLDSYVNYQSDLSKLNIDQKNKREALTEAILQSNISDTSKLYLNSMTKQNILKQDNLEIKHKDELNILRKQEQEREIALLRSQINLRNQIINHQKHVIHTHTKQTSITELAYEVADGDTARLQNYPMPKNHYFNKEAYYAQKHKRKPIGQSQQYAQQLPQKPHPYVPSIPNVRIIDSISEVHLSKQSPQHPKIPLQKPISTNSMGSLPQISPNRNINKFVYDWKSGGYKFLQDTSSKSKNQPTGPSEKDLDGLNSSYRLRSRQNQSFYSNTSRSESKSRRNMRLTKSHIKLPGLVQNSPYVKGFLNKDLERRDRLQQMNNRMKIKNHLQQS